MDNLLLNLETEFYFITGVYLEGVGGLLFGLIFFSLAIYLIRFERKQEQIIANIEISNEILKEEKSIIEDLIVAAHNNAKSKLKTKTAEEISKATGGFNIPGFKWPI